MAIYMDINQNKNWRKTTIAISKITEITNPILKKTLLK